MISGLVCCLLLCVLGCWAGTTPAGLQFLEENRLKEGVVTLPSGLQYRVITSGDGEVHPTLTTTCICHYRGTTIDGTEFDSSYNRGSPSSFAPNQVIPGWKEALQLMKEGDKWEIVVPAELAYGDRSMGKVITPGSVLIFELHFLKIAPSTIFTSITSMFGNGPPIWMILFAYFSYIMFFKVAPIIKNHFFPDKVIPTISLEDARANPANTQVYLDVKIGDKDVQRIEFVLFNGVVPRTAENFRCLCTGEKGVGKSKKPLHFKNSPIHRIIPNFMYVYIFTSF